MQAGKLRHRVKLQSATEGRDDTGGTTRTWATFATEFASIEPLRGRELFQAQQVNAQLSHKVTIRYRDDVTPSHRVLYGTRTLNILSVATVDERCATTELMCTEEVA